MFKLFKKSPLLSDDAFFFQIDTYKWLLKNFDSNDFYNKCELILPTEEFFPEILRREKITVQKLFDQVKEYAGMKSWQCELVEQEEDIETQLSRGTLLGESNVEPLGTFSINEEKVQITYNPKLKKSPDQLIATFAHELAHYLICACEKEPPGGWDNEEFVTDIAAVFMGFGLFMANTAFHFGQYSDGEYSG